MCGVSFPDEGLWYKYKTDTNSVFLQIYIVLGAENSLLHKYEHSTLKEPEVSLYFSQLPCAGRFIFYCYTVSWA
jgi:hypothetical protein